MKSYISLLLLIIFTSCVENDNVDTPKYLGQTEADIIEYLQTNSLTAEKSDTGLYYIIENEGEGDPIESTATVKVIYSGYYLDGNEFDASTDEGYTFKIEKLIAGFSEGITYFKKGGKGKLFIPPSLAYGENGVGSIPGGAVLIFDIEILEVYNPQTDADIIEYIETNNLTAQKTDLGVYYSTEKEGDGEPISNTSIVTVVYKGYLLDGTEFDASSETGAQLNLQTVIEGFADGITNFKVGGKGTLLIPPSLAYGENGSTSIPGESVVIFDIEILAIK